MSCQPLYMKLVYKWSLFDQCCLLCDEHADNPYPLCQPCEAELPWLRDRCRVCALPLPMAGFVCGQCSRRRPAFHSVQAPWQYAFPLDSVITRFKHNARWPMGRLLAEMYGLWLSHRFAQGLARPDRLIPVPLARQRLRQRGFNQAAMVARWLSPALGIACDEQCVQRHHATTAQQNLSARARKRNLQGAFSLIHGAYVEGLHLALVDDVLTTGATAHALARLLKQAGARRVDVYCLARTAKPGHA